MRLSLCICGVLLFLGCSGQDTAGLPSRDLTENESKAAKEMAVSLSSSQLDLLIELKEFELNKKSVEEDSSLESELLTAKEAIRMQKELGVYRSSIDGPNEVELIGLADRLIADTKRPEGRNVETWAETKELSEVEAEEKKIRESIASKLETKKFDGISEQAVEVKFYHGVIDHLKYTKKEPSPSVGNSEQ